MQNSRVLGFAAIVWLSATLAHGWPSPPAPPNVPPKTYDPGAVPVYAMTLDPMAPPDPPLKYHFIPRFAETKPGNAAPFYYRALLMMNSSYKSDELDKLYEHLDDSIDAFPVNEVESNLPDNALDLVAEGAQREYCDWGFEVRDNPNFYTTFLPEIQEARSLGRIVALQARVQYLKGDFDGAIRTLGIGFVLARHVGECPFIVGGLVGIAIQGVMTEELLGMIDQPGAPNLYWAIASMPRPLIDMRKSLEVDVDVALSIFPFLKNPEELEYSAEEWLRLLEDATAEFSYWLEGNKTHQSPTQRRLELVTVAAIAYPQAKQELIAGGLRAEEVDAMPVGQVLAISASRNYARQRDHMLKWFYVPYWQVDRTHKESPPASVVFLPMAEMLMPAMDAYQQATARSETRMAEAQAIEAIRAYAASHDGQLPDQLDDVDMPMLPIAYTNQPFEYQRSGSTAVLRTASPDPGFGPLGREFRISIESSNMP